MKLNWLAQVLRQFVVCREMQWEMTKRDLKVLNKGACLGMYWLLLGPLVQAGGYVVIVCYLFGARKASPDMTTIDFTLYFLAGMLPWQMIAKTLQEAPTLITSRMDVIKQVLYPIETLPMSSVVLGSIAGLVSFAVYLVVALFSGKLGWSLLLMPLPLALLVPLIVGISWIMSVVGIVFKDLRELVIVMLGLMIYFTPVVVMKSVAGPRVWGLILLNPLSHVIISFRDVFTAEFHPLSWGISLAMSCCAFLLGAFVVNKAKVKINEYI